jgi:pimeloyl-ACP methyl ester carboxylesterase
MRAERLSIPSGSLEVAWWGAPADAAPTLVLLHEGLGCVALWRDFPARLAHATGCGVFAYSRLGYGQSDGITLPRPLTYMQDEAREVLPLVLDAIGADRVLLLGHSDGGSIAAAYAGSCQDRRLAGLVLLAPHFFVEEVSLRAIEDARRRWEEGDLRERLARHHRDPEAAFLGWNRAWLDPDFPRVFDLQPEIAHIRIPVLIVQGEADPYGTVEQARMLEREAYCPVETLLLPGVGHAPHLEAPERVLPAIADFAGRAFAAQGTSQPPPPLA